LSDTHKKLITTSREALLRRGCVRSYSHMPVLAIYYYDVPEIIMGRYCRKLSFQVS